MSDTDYFLLIIVQMSEVDNNFFLAIRKLALAAFQKFAQVNSCLM